MCHSRVLVSVSLRSLTGVSFGPLGVLLSRFSAWKNFKVDSAWIKDCYLYYEVLFLCILVDLEMCHSRVIGLEIFEILSKRQFWPSFGSPRTFFLRGKVSTCRVRGLKIVAYIM